MLESYCNADYRLDIEPERFQGKNICRTTAFASFEQQ